MWRRCRGQGLIEVAVALPIVLVLAFGVIALAQLAHAQMGASAVARESARAGALAHNGSDATTRGDERGREVAAGYRLDQASLQLIVTAPEWGRGQEVTADARYTVSFDYLPLLNWTTVEIATSHSERVDLYRSLPREDDAE